MRILPYSLSIILLTLLSTSTALNVALFPSTGCYSHDMMMRQIGSGFNSSQDQVTWIQTFLYDFGFGPMKIPSSWDRISVNGTDEEGRQLMQEAGSLLWEQNVPTDFERAWDLRGSFQFFKILERHQNYCEQMLQQPNFIEYMKKQSADVVVLDHFLQECIGGLSHLLNSSVVQFSNWPIADGYITSLNVPANPSAIPKTGTPFSGLGMSFGERVANVLFHNIIVVTRYIQIHVLNRMFARFGYPEVSIIQSEADRLIYAGRSEFLFDVVRPINNRVKHFGGANCLEPSDYVVALPSNIQNTPSIYKNSAILRDGKPLNCHSSDFASNGSSCSFSCMEVSSDQNCANNTLQIAMKGLNSHLKHREHIYASLDTAQVANRMQEATQAHPNVNWQRLARTPFVLVSFGSVAQVDNMSSDLLRLLLSTFSESSQLIVWQTNSDIEGRIKEENMTLSSNIILLPWAPIKEFLAHPNLQYIVCHGGINTMNELLLFGVPVIGVPLQGDQGSNLRRLVDLGAAEVVPTLHLRAGKLATAMKKMESGLDSYWSRASQLSSMLRFYRKHHQHEQDFWIRWSARHGKRVRVRGSRLFRFNYIGDTENLFLVGLTAICLTALILLSQ